MRGLPQHVVCYPCLPAFFGWSVKEQNLRLCSPSQLLDRLVHFFALRCGNGVVVNHKVELAAISQTSQAKKRIPVQVIAAQIDQPYRGRILHKLELVRFFSTKNIDYRHEQKGEAVVA